MSQQVLLVQVFDDDVDQRHSLVIDSVNAEQPQAGALNGGGRQSVDCLLYLAGNDFSRLTGLGNHRFVNY